MSKRIGFKTTLDPDMITALKVEAATKGIGVNDILEDLFHNRHIVHPTEDKPPTRPQEAAKPLTIVTSPNDVATIVKEKKGKDFVSPFSKERQTGKK